VGDTVSYVTVQVVDAWNTITNADGGVARLSTTRTFHLQTPTVVESQRISRSSLTVYAAPVNGYNMVTRQAVGTGDATTPPGVSFGVLTETGVVSPGVIAGAVVGGVLGLGLMALGAYFIRKRYRHSAAAVDQPDPAAWEGGPDRGGHALPPRHGQATMSEMSGVNQPQELPFGRYAHELPGGK
jgi:hypothetical protein